MSKKTEEPISSKFIFFLIFMFCFGLYYILRDDKINEIRNNLLTIKSEFAYQCRLSEIEKLLTEKGSEFRALPDPPYIINKSK